MAVRWAKTKQCPLERRLDNLLVSAVAGYFFALVERGLVTRLLLLQMYETPCRKGMLQMQWRCYVGRQVVLLLHSLLPRPDRQPSINYATNNKACTALRTYLHTCCKNASPSFGKTAASLAFDQQPFGVEHL